MRHLTRLAGPETALTVSVEVLASTVSEAFIDMCLGRGAYAATGATPLQTVDPIGGTPCVKLVVQVKPNAGPVRTRTYAKAYLKASESAKPTGSTWALAWTCYGRSEL
jgi:hypothetical protein